MSPRIPNHEAGGSRRSEAFVLYVEGPRDRDILVRWARRTSPGLARALTPACVILGGRRPARAASHLRRLRETAPDARGLCVLDGDETERPSELELEPGLDCFVWGRRHIESYLLVPRAIRAAVRVRGHDAPFERLLREHLPRDEAALGSIDAKRLLGPKGPFARFLGRSVAPSHVARAMSAEELHDDVHALFGRIREGLGMVERSTSVAVRSPDLGGSSGGRGIIP